MNDKPEDNNIDNLFRDSVEPIETEPSDHFWNRAYDGILKKENTGYEKRLIVWKSISGLLALAVIGLIAYTVYISRFAKGAKQKEVTYAANHQQITAANISFKSVVTPAAIAVSANASTSAQRTVTTNVNKSGPLLANNKTPVRRHSKKIASSAVAYAGVTEKQAYTNERYDRTEVTNIIYLNERSPDAINLPLYTKTTASPVGDNIRVEDSLYMVPLGPPPTAPIASISVKKKSVSRLSVYAFGGASIAQQTIKDNNRNDNISPSGIKSKEHQTGGYAIGINLGYDLSSKLTLQMGLTYRAYRYAISPTTVSVHTGDWGTGYPFVTNTGTISMPWISGYSPQGYDTLATASGHAQCAYITIPLKLKYNFAEKRRLRAYLTAGTALNMLVYNYAAVHCENSWGEEDVYAYTMDGTSKINLSYLVGIGVEYKLGKGFALYAEPYYLGAITPSVQSKAITVLSSSYNITGGINYHF